MTVATAPQVATLPVSELRTIIARWRKFDSYDDDDVDGILEDFQRLADQYTAPFAGQEKPRNDEIWEMVNEEDGAKYVGVRAYPDDPDGQWSLIDVNTGKTVWASDDQFTRTHRLVPASILPEPDYQSTRGLLRLWEIGPLHVVTCGEAVQVNREGTSILTLDGVQDPHIAQLISVLSAAHEHSHTTISEALEGDAEWPR